MSGVPGSGKSSLAKAIRENLNVVIVDHDIIKTALLEKIIGNLSMQYAGQASYHIDWSLIESFLSQQHNVILDSPCLYDEMIDKGLDLAKKYNAKYKYVECLNKDFSSVNDRLQSRNKKLSQILQFASYDSFIDTVNSSKRPPHHNYLVVDSSKPVDSYIKSVIDYLND